MVQKQKLYERRTTVDLVFEFLYEEIASMRLLPGAKISEAEVAGQFDVSRQPVRDAFSRLENLDLLLIRPQKATEVKRFSTNAIATARFVRAGVEAEVLRQAAQLCGQEGAALLEACLDEQRAVVKENSYDRFRVLDYQFHKTLCIIAEVEFVFDVIEKNKAKIDRLCVLGLNRDEHLGQLLDDHSRIAAMVTKNNEEGAVKAGRLHLSRLDSTIKKIQKENADFFDDLAV